MPIFEYRCSSCGEVFERLVLTRSEKSSVECPHCGSANVEMVYSVFSSAGGNSAKSSCTSSGYS